MFNPSDLYSGQDRLCIVSVAGTRPEAIKLAPIILEAAGRTGVEHRLVSTGQHRDLFDDALATFGLAPDRRINARWHSDDRETVTSAIAHELDWLKADIVLVQGDTDTALIAGHAAETLGLPIGHVEAGLRSFDLSSPFPEEQNRVAIAKMATLHFAPSEAAAVNLRREGVGGDIFVTGNTGIDALFLVEPRTASPTARGPILVTCHRRENFGAPLERICSALGQLADAGLQFLVPLHSNPNSAEAMRALLSGYPSIALVPALSYRDLIAAIRAAPFVLSDSGGLQEECAALGIPLLLMRENTERPEVVTSGNCLLVGSDPAAIIASALLLTRDPAARERMAHRYFPYGEGQASSRILDAIIACHAAKRTGVSPDQSGLLLQ